MPCSGVAKAAKCLTWAQTPLSWRPLAKWYPNSPALRTLSGKGGNLVEADYSQIGILAEGFLNAAETKFTGKIDDRGKQLVDAQGKGFDGNDIGHLLDHLGVEGATHGDGRVENGRVQREEAVETLALDVGWDACRKSAQSNSDAWARDCLPSSVWLIW